MYFEITWAHFKKCVFISLHVHLINICGFGMCICVYIGMSVLSSQTAEATEVKLGRNVGLDLRISVFFCDLDPRPFDLRGRNFCCFLPAGTAIEPGNVYYFA